MFFENGLIILGTTPRLTHYTLHPHAGLKHTHTHTDRSSIDNNSDSSRRTQPSSSSSGRGAKRSNSEKGPRVRTVLSEQQLQTLRTVYASNPRPDALLKEHLVEITQLSPRVIRVWFQNKRCKDKKKMIHAQEQARVAANTVSMCTYSSICLYKELCTHVCYCSLHIDGLMYMYMLHAS